MISLRSCTNLIGLTLVAQLAIVVAAASVVESAHNAPVVNPDSPALSMISDEDLVNLKQIKYQIEKEFSDFKTVNEVHAFLDRVKLLVQKHPTNVAFAQGDLKELHKFLSQEIVTKLIRVDTEPFRMPIGDDKMPLAQKAAEEDDLTSKLFGGPLRSLSEARRQQLSRAEDGNHKDGNFFTNFWCKISGGCPNQ